MALVAFPLLLHFFGPPGLANGELDLDVIFGAPLLVYSTIGAYIVSRRPTNLVGWTLCGIGFVFGANILTEAYAKYALVVQPGYLPGGAYMAWISSTGWLGLPVLFLAAALLVLLFPDGKLPARGWRSVVLLAVGGSAMSALWLATEEGSLRPYHSLPNPFAVGGLAGTVLEVLGRIGAAVLLLCCVAAVISVFVRLSTSEGERRQQLKWFAYATVVLLSTFFLLLPVAGMMSAVGCHRLAPC